MAYMIPEKPEKFIKMTEGEVRLFNTLKNALPKDYVVWIEPNIRNRYPDFVVLGPDLGIVVLEVKDWSLDYIKYADTNKYVLSNGDSRQNPLLQARGYTFNIVNTLKEDRNLIYQEGYHKGKLSFGYGYGVVFTNIDSREFLKSPFRNSINKDNIIFRDDIKSYERLFFKSSLKNKLNTMIPVNVEFDKISGRNMDRIIKKLTRSSNISEKVPSFFKERIKFTLKILTLFIIISILLFKVLK